MYLQASGSDDNGDQQLKLYSYYRSSCSFRVRIALNLKGFLSFNFYFFQHLMVSEFELEFMIISVGLKYEYKAVNLLKGEQFSPGY